MDMQKLVTQATQGRVNVQDLRKLVQQIRQKGWFRQIQDLYYAYFDEIKCTLSILEGKNSIYWSNMSNFLIS